MTPLAVIVTPGAAEGPGPDRLMWDLRGALRPGDTLVLVCGPPAPPDRDAALRARLFQSLEGMPGIRMEVISPGLAARGAVPSAAPSGPGPGEAIEIGLAVLAGLDAWDAVPEAVLCLPGGARPSPDFLEPIRRRLAEPDAPDLMLLHPRGGEAGRELLSPFRAVLKRRLLENGRPRADAAPEAGGTVAFCDWLVERAGPAIAPLAVAPDLLPPLPEGGPALARALAACAAARPGDRARIARRVPALFASAPPGARAAAAPILDSAGLPRPPAPQAPALGDRAPLPVWRGGPHAHRMPLAYPALAPLWEGRIRLVEAPAEARLLVFAHPLDTLSAGFAEAEAAASGTPVALLSEEPFWDSLFSPDPLAARVTLPGAHLGEWRLHQINHHRSAIFDFERIPYYLLTEHGYLAAYAGRFARLARKSAQDWREDHAARPVDLVFMAERREEAFHDVAFPESDLLGLCAWRTRLALACDGRDGSRVERLGASWQGGPTRFEIRNWHFDKLMRLDGRARIVSALENTHQPSYLSEKLFDALACGARPLYMASPAHRLRDLGLPEAAWIDLWGLDSAAAAGRVAAALREEPDWQAHATAIATLARLFADPRAAVAERRRVGRALVSELVRTAELGPA